MKYNEKFGSVFSKYPELQDNETYNLIKVLMTPKIAKTILRNNYERNRGTRINTLKNLIQIIKNDEWDYTASIISIDKEGKLLDGQHRLKAIVQVGKSLPVLIDVKSRSVYTKMDTGQPKYLHDFLKHEFGIKNEKTIASILNTVIAYNIGDIPYNKLSGSGYPSIDYNRLKKMTIDEKLMLYTEYYNDLPEFVLNIKPPLSKPVTSAIYYILYKNCRQTSKVQHFFLSLVDSSINNKYATAGIEQVYQTDRQLIIAKEIPNKMEYTKIITHYFFRYYTNMDIPRTQPRIKENNFKEIIDRIIQIDNFNEIY